MNHKIIQVEVEDVFGELPAEIAAECGFKNFNPCFEHKFLLDRVVIKACEEDMDDILVSPIGEEIGIVVNAWRDNWKFYTYNQFYERYEMTAFKLAEFLDEEEMLQIFHNHVAARMYKTQSITS